MVISIITNTHSAHVFDALLFVCCVDKLHNRIDGLS